MFFALALLFAAIQQCDTWRRAALAGMVFGLVFFMLGLRWIWAALTGYIGLPPPTAAIIFLLFCAFLSLYPTCAAALSQKLSASRTSAPRSILMPLLALGGLWALAETLRGVLFSGFPWLAIGYSQTPHSPLAGYLPLLGIDGVNLILAITAALAAAVPKLIARRNIKLAAAAAVAILVFFVGGGVAKAVSWAQPIGELQISLLQGNVPQDLKWEPQRVQKSLRDYLRMTQTAAVSAKKEVPHIIIMPETALPLSAEQLPPSYWADLQTAAGNGIVLSGMFIRENDAIYNAAVAVTEGAPDYRKRHLTPYGETLPLAELLRPLLRAADIPFFGLSAGKRSTPLILADAKLAISICYEDIFSNEWRDQLPHADVLVNITNDGWFDNSDMARQHLQISQTRAAEFGRYLVRATNTGQTAVVDDKGRIVRQLPPQTQDYLTAVIPRLQKSTPYVAFGPLSAILLSLLVVAGAVWWGR